MAVGYALSTPLAIAIGLGVRTKFNTESQTTLVINGVFDSISAGILIYTSLVELVAHDFLFSPSMRAAPLKVVFAAIVRRLKATRHPHSCLRHADPSTLHRGGWFLVLH